MANMPISTAPVLPTAPVDTRGARIVSATVAPVYTPPPATYYFVIPSHEMLLASATATCANRVRPGYPQEYGGEGQSSHAWRNGVGPRTLQTWFSQRGARDRDAILDWLFAESARAMASQGSFGRWRDHREIFAAELEPKLEKDYQAGIDSWVKFLRSEGIQVDADG